MSRGTESFTKASSQPTHGLLSELLPPLGPKEQLEYERDLALVGLQERAGIEFVYEGRVSENTAMAISKLTTPRLVCDPSLIIVPGLY